MNERKWSRRDVLLAGTGLGMGMAFPSMARAQAYPTKPVKVEVGFSPGGLTDVLARMVAQGLSDKLGGQFVVENKTGNAGNIATTFVAKAAPDGYTLLVSSVGQIAVSPHTDPSMQVDPVKELAHITMIGEGDFVLAINPEVPAKDIREFIALVKKNPGKYFYGDSGAGGNLHLYTEYFLMQAGLDVQPVHYRGGTALMPDFLSNRVQISLNSYPVTEAHIKAGKLRPLLVIGKQREPQLPNVPTASEIGMSELAVCTNWFGVHTTKGTPEPIIKTLNETIVAFLKTDAAREKLIASGIRPVGDTPQAFGARIAADYQTFGAVARKAKIKIE